MKTLKRKYRRLKHDYRWKWFSGRLYDLTHKTASLRLRHKDGRTLGYNTDSFGTLTQDKTKAKRYTLNDSIRESELLKSGEDKLESLYRKPTTNGDFLDHLFGTLNTATFNAGYTEFEKSELYFDLYTYSFYEKLKFLLKKL